MRGLKIVLLVNFISGGMYTLLLVLLPRQLTNIVLVPQEIAWVRYLVPIYLALTIASWHAYRKPSENLAVIQALMVMWVGLFFTHLINAALGDEQLRMTAIWLVFDAIIAAWMVYSYPWRKSATQEHKAVPEINPN